MPMEELEQALLEAKWGDAEADVPDLISRLLGIPREVVVRVEFLFHAAQDSRLGAVYLGEDEIPYEVQNAMKDQVRRGMLRIRVREAIRDSGALYVAPRALIKKPKDICTGCPFSLKCLTENYSTPDACFKKGPPARIQEGRSGEPVHLLRFPKGGVQVFPLRLQGDRVSVRSDHPKGSYEVDIGDLCI